MAYQTDFQKVIRLTEAQFQQLEAGQTVGDETGLSDHNLYLVETGGSAPVRVVKWYQTGSGTTYAWYRLWSDGFLEQGGHKQSSKWNVASNISLVQAYQNTDYCITCSIAQTSAEGTPAHGCDAAWINNKTTTTFQARTGYQSGTLSTAWYVDWYACGVVSNATFNNLGSLAI